MPTCITCSGFGYLLSGDDKNESIPCTVCQTTGRTGKPNYRRTVEIVYTWQDGREEVRYRKPENSVEALRLIKEVTDCVAKHGTACPYSWRYVDGYDVLSTTKNTT